ncbi:hypothetical protein SLEP1_g34267 [Rubroshorea leprosula]|uniref:Uncharacterized protein n=1 Tax=Rubroshorea leprosula TaxID=152421 RepID=A0AAV5KJH6_9ROSI|nr:hypothetical protein SLEP1_g34267 [Rubroshorea leprosula]
MRIALCDTLYPNQESMDFAFQFPSPLGPGRRNGQPPLMIDASFVGQRVRQGITCSSPVLIPADVGDRLLGFAKMKACPMSWSLASNWGLEILCIRGRD